MKFNAIDFLLDDVQWSDRPVEFDSNQIKKLIENNQSYTTWEIANILKICRSSVENYLHQFGYVNYFDVWVPYKLSKKKKTLPDHISGCNSLLKHNDDVMIIIYHHFKNKL